MNTESFRLRIEIPCCTVILFRSLYHGDSDPAVPVSGSRDAYRALKAAGADVRYHEFPECGHVCWWKAFEMPDFMSWMFSKSKNSIGN